MNSISKRVVLAAILVCISITSWAVAQDAPENQISDEEAKEIVKQFKETYRNSDPMVRVGAVDLLTQGFHDSLLKELCKVAGRDPEAPVRVAAIGSLSDYGGHKGVLTNIPRILSASEKMPEAQVAAIRLMGEIGNPKLARFVIAMMNSGTTSVAKSAFEAAGLIRNRSIFDPLIKSLGAFEGEIQNLDRRVSQINRDLQARNYRGGRRAGAAGGTRGGTSSGTSSGAGGGGGRSGDPDTRPTRRELERQRDQAQDRIQRARELIPAIESSLSQLSGESLNGAKGWSDWWQVNSRTFTFND